MSVALYVKMGADSSGSQSLISRWDFITSTGLFNLAVQNTGQLVMTIAPDGIQQSFTIMTGFTVANGWFHVAFTMQANGYLVFYVDGVQKSARQAVSFPNSVFPGLDKPIRVGYSANLAQFDELSFWGSAVSASDIIKTAKYIQVHASGMAASSTAADSGYPVSAAVDGIDNLSTNGWRFSSSGQKLLIDWASTLGPLSIHTLRIASGVGSTDRATQFNIYSTSDASPTFASSTSPILLVTRLSTSGGIDSVDVVDISFDPIEATAIILEFVDSAATVNEVSVFHTMEYWSRFWWLPSGTGFPTSSVDLLHNPWGTCNDTQSTYCFQQLPSCGLNQDSTYLMAYDTVNDIRLKWKLSSSNSLSSAMWTALTSNVKPTSVSNTSPWVPFVLSGTFSYTVDSFTYTGSSFLLGNDISTECGAAIAIGSSYSGEFSFRYISIISSSRSCFL